MKKLFTAIVLFLVLLPPAWGADGDPFLQGKAETEEGVEDIVGGMVTGNTETGITVTYQDGDGTIDFVIGNQSSITLDEQSSDPANPSDGDSVIWVGNGTGTGNDGDIFLKQTYGSGPTTYTTALKHHRFNVRNYGAEGNGSNDDTAEIQAAIDAAEAAGRGTVFFPDGIYKVSDSLTIQASNVNITGESRTGTVIEQHADKPLIILGSTSASIGSIVIKDIKLEDESGAGTHTGANNASTLTDSAAAWVVDSLIGLTVNNTSNDSSCTITDNDATTITCTLSGRSGTFTGTDGATTIMTDANAFFVVDNLIGKTITNTSDSSSCTITDNTATTVTCTLSGSNEWNTGETYTISGTENDWDTNDTYTITGDAADVGIQLEVSGSSYGMSNLNISNVRFQDFTKGITNVRTPAGGFWTIEECTFEGTQSYGIYSDYGMGIFIISNSFFHGATVAAIYIDGTNAGATAGVGDFTINGNNIDGGANNPNYGIFLRDNGSGSCGNFSVVGNKIDGFESGSGYAYPIYINGCNAFRVLGNSFAGGADIAGDAVTLVSCTNAVYDYDDRTDGDSDFGLVSGNILAVGGEPDMTTDPNIWIEKSGAPKIMFERTGAAAQTWSVYVNADQDLVWEDTDADGNIAMTLADGTTTTLTIDGTIVVTGCTGCTPDYVFEPDYELLSLDEFSSFIQKNRHLPNINRDENTDMIKMDQSILEKVEEQALYILELHERLKILEARLAEKTP